MFSLFRKNDPYLYVLYFVAILVTRLVFFLVYDHGLNTVHFSSSLLFGQGSFSDLPLFWHALCNGALLLFNSLMVNQLVLNNNASKEHNYLTGFVFILLMSSAPSLFFFSGLAIAITCSIIVLNLVMAHVKQRASEENIFFTGVFAGIASLCFSPLVIMPIWVIMVYFFFTRTIRRRYVLSLFGFLFPFLISYCVALFTDFTFDLAVIFGRVNANAIWQGPFNIHLVFLAFPLFISLTELLKGLSGQGMTNHQIHFNRVMMLVLFFAIGLSILWNTPFGGGHLAIIPMAYFSAQVLIDTKKVWLREVFSLIFILHLALPYLIAAYF